MRTHAIEKQIKRRTRLRSLAGAALSASLLISLMVGNTLRASAATSAAPPGACFSQPIATGTGSGATALVAGDFFNHQNGTLDVVTGNSGRFGTGPGTISVLKGKGDGTFDYTGDVSIPDRVESPTAMVTGDFNHDGNLDVAIAGGLAGVLAGGRVSILLGNGNGTFQPAVTYSVADGPQSITAADLKHDGFLDLVMANGGSSVSVLMNKEDGTGTFNAAVSYPLPHYSSGSIAIGDVNGDGKLDMVATDPDGVEVFSGNGDGTFNPTPTAFSSGLSSAPTGIALADANGDGKLDIVLSGNAGGYALLLNTGNVNGNATFKTSTILMGQFASGVAIGDLNGDGIPDIEVGGPIHPAGGSGVAIGDGDGTFQTEVAYGYTAQWANLADINGDGRLDILGINNDKVLVLLNRSCTTFYFAEGFTGAGGCSFSEALSLLSPNASGIALLDYFTQTGHLPTRQVGLTAGEVLAQDVDHDVGNGQQVSARVTLPWPGIAERTLHFNCGGWHGSTDKVGATMPATEWDFAEGSTLPFFSEYLTLQNPQSNAVTVNLDYFTDSGAHPVKTVSLPANGRTTVEVFNGDLTSPSATCIPNGNGSNCGVGSGIGGVSVKVVASAAIIVERPFYVNGFSFGFGPIRDGHVAFGANSPGTMWNFAEGTTLAGFNEYLTLQNPGTGPASVTLSYITDVGRAVARTLTINPQTRVTVEVFKGDTTTPSISNCTPNGTGANCGVGSGVGGVSVQVASSVPIVAERPMYIVHDFGNGTVAGAHVVVGATRLGTLFGFAAASTRTGDSDFLTIQNPSPNVAANITVTFYPPGGPPVIRTFAVPASTRHTVEIFGTTEGVGSGIAPLGIVVASDQPVLVEKPTYSSNVDTYGATDTAGYSPATFAAS